MSITYYSKVKIFFTSVARAIDTSPRVNAPTCALLVQLDLSRSTIDLHARE